MAAKTKRSARKRSTGVKPARGSRKVMKAQQKHTSVQYRASQNATPRFPARAKLAVRKPLIRQEMPVDEKHVAAIRAFELGLEKEHRQNYRKAREIFEKLVATAPADVADRSRVHLKACIERLGANGPAPKTAGDYHVLGVAELNVRDLDRAVEHLNKARKLDPEREEIRYALAAAYSLRGDRDAALEHLKAAIVLRPQNRFQARHDPDFQPISADERFRALMSQNGYSVGASS
jgi:tetratricopeptide (TPR) repeat protein